MGTSDPTRRDPCLLPKTPSGRQQAWSIVEATWAGTVDRASRLEEPLLHQRVNDEWSFVETLRHLVFVTDAWGRRTLLCETAPYHRLGLPPDHKIGSPDPAVDVTTWGIDVHAEATLDEVLAVRRGRQQMIRLLVDGLTDADLAGACDHNPAPGFPPSTGIPAQLAWDVIIGEEWAHHGFATRDLAQLGAG